MQNDLIPAREAAKSIGMNTQSVGKSLRRLGIEPIQMKSKSHRGQMVNFITQDDYTKLKNSYSARTIDNEKRELKNRFFI